MKTEDFLVKQISAKEKEYWLKELSQPLPSINLPRDFSNHSSKNLNRLNKTVFLTQSLTNSLRNFYSTKSRQALMLAVYFALISRLSNETDIMVGLSTNDTTYPIRVSIEGLKRFNELLSVIKEKLENTSKYSFITEEIVENKTSKTLFETTFSMNFNNKLQNEAIINWDINEQEDNITINVQYNSDSFKTKTIERFIEYYINILKAVVKEPKTNIYDVNILTKTELELYNNLNNTQRTFPKDKTIPKMFEEAVYNFPNNIAISSDKGLFTYKKLNECSNKLANGLIEKGLKKGDFVTIFMERSLETIISILGILKAGGVYVPLDPEHPEERNTYIISDTKSPFIVTKNFYIDKAKQLVSNNTSVKEIIVIENDIDNFSKENPSIHIDSEDLAYVIYTSGSTGKPKGTLIAHEGVVNLGHLIHNEFNINEKDILTQFATYSFDASVWDTFGSLFWGARLHLLSPEERISVEAFADAIDRTKATFIAILPTVFFNQLAAYLSNEDCKKLSTVKRVSVGGEALSGEIVRAFQSKFGNSIEIVNLYGPTESTVVATGYRIVNLIPENQVNIPIGKPFDNYEVYIVNEKNQLSPINVPGEIYISSVALAKGYLNQETKTKEAFVENPFKENSMIYKSGDIGRILENGVIEYVGRKDSQVKIRGHRIEIGEIEDNLVKHPKIQDVAIIAKKYNNEYILVGYYTSKNSQKIEVSQLKSFLLERVPSYMIPKYIISLEQMPISPTGKIDRKKLMTLELPDVEENRNYVAPQNETQNIIANSWKKVLNVDRVGINDDFFELGGHSLKIMRVLVLLKPHFPNLKINDFFTYKTVADLSTRAEELQQQQQNLNCKKRNEYKTWETYDLNEYPSPLKYKSRLNLYTKPECILLTGATGYLGSHILYELLKNTEAKICCLVRKSNNKSSLEKLLDTLQSYFDEETIKLIDKRVFIIDGDLKQDNLGLSSVDEIFIEENVDTIIHAAADVRHFGDTSHFEKVNIQGTKSLLDIAKSKKGIRFHYVSTLGIPQDLSLSGKWEKVISKKTFDNDLELENVYTNSKLRAEKLVYKAGEDGLLITVYRAGNLTCRFDNGCFQKNINSNAFYRMIKSMLLLGKAPKANCYLDFTPIDYASKSIVNLACQEATIGHTFHICNPKQILYSSVVDMINNFGYKIDLLDELEYEKWLFNNNISKNEEGLELAIAQLDGDGVTDSNYRFACPNTIKYLHPECLKFTQIDQDFINRMLNYAIKIKFFPEP